MKRLIPNFFTLLNLLSGCIATVLAVEGELVLAVYFAFLGIFFDFFDGFFARKLNVQSRLGVELDSLADMVTSGLVPGIVMYKLLEITLNTSSAISVVNEWTENSHWLGTKVSILPFLGFLITLASAYRLAKFNISENQTDHFIGMPTPANTLLILSLPLILKFQHSDVINEVILSGWFLIGLTLISTVLLNAPIKLLSLKFKDFSFSNNSARYILLLSAIVLLILFKFAGIPLIIAAYIIISIFNK